MKHVEIIRFIDHPEMKSICARWFHEKWKIPLSAYEQSMDMCLTGQKVVPQWYMAMIDQQIVGGLGVIDCDFHQRKDLSPNVCAVYTEKKYRGQGIAGKLLDTVCEDMKNQGIDTLYLVTDHTSFYERYGWKFLCMVQEENSGHMTRMYVHKA